MGQVAVKHEAAATWLTERSGHRGRLDATFAGTSSLLELPESQQAFRLIDEGTMLAA